MKFVADENFPRDALWLLRQSGFGVASIAETNPGLPDIEVLALASAEGRTLLTFDKDFGDLAFRQGLLASCGVILFRTGSLSPMETAVIALATLNSGVAWAGHFCVVSDRKIRVTPLPPRPGST
jgi:predicted nuclease of predicted toxin-antitoxin system